MDTYKAFQTLSASRPSGMGTSSIPLSEMLAYLDIFEITNVDERESFVTTMQALDSIYLKHVVKRREQESNRPPSLSGRRRRK